MRHRDVPLLLGWDPFGSEIFWILHCRVRARVSLVFISHVSAKMSNEILTWNIWFHHKSGSLHWFVWHLHAQHPVLKRKQVDSFSRHMQLHCKTFATGSLVSYFPAFSSFWVYLKTSSCLENNFFCKHSTLVMGLCWTPFFSKWRHVCLIGLIRWIGQNH